jgi:hypothetical protein
MRTRDKEFGTIEFTGKVKEKTHCPAMFHPNEDFLSYNRLTLIGDKFKGVDLLQVRGKLVKCKLVESKSYVGSLHTLKGEGFSTQSGISRSGPGLDDDSI